MAKRVDVLPHLFEPEITVIGVSKGKSILDICLNLTNFRPSKKVDSFVLFLLQLTKDINRLYLYPN